MLIVWGPLWFVLPVILLYLVMRSRRSSRRAQPQVAGPISSARAKQASSDRLHSVAARYNRERR